MILVVGATGMVGGMITRQLLGQSKQVRILVRPGSQYEPLVEAGAQPVFGDLKDRATLDTACEGIDSVVTTANSAQRGGNDNVQTVDLEGNANLIEAASAAGVSHFVFVSAMIADPNSPVPFLQAKALTEERLRNSGMEYTILAPNQFMEVWVATVVGMPAAAGQPVTLVGEGKRKHSFVSAGDVAQFITASVDNPTATNRRLVIGGPEPLSYRDAVGIYERVLGRPLEVRSVAPGEPVPGLPEPMSQMVAALEMFDSPVDMDETSRTFGVTLTPLEEVVRRSVAAPV